MFLKMSFNFQNTTAFKTWHKVLKAWRNVLFYYYFTESWYYFDSSWENYFESVGLFL